MTENDQLVAEIAAALLERAADHGPAEVSTQVKAEHRAFDILAEAYFSDPKKALAGGGNGAGYLKFGLPGIEELLTPIFLAAAAEIVSQLSDRGVKLSRRMVRRVLSPPPVSPASPPEAPALTPEQWTLVRQVLVAALVRHARMSRQRAETIASAVVGDGLTGQDRPE